MRSYTIQESASMSLCAYNLCNVRHGYSPSMPCEKCRADIVRLVDAPEAGTTGEAVEHWVNDRTCVVAVPAGPMPEVTGEDVAGIRSRMEDYVGLADQYEQLSCPEGAKPMHLKAESMTRILALLSWAQARQGGGNG